MLHHANLVVDSTAELFQELPAAPLVWLSTSTSTQVNRHNADHEFEVIYTTGTTDSINLVANSYGLKNLSNGDEIIVTEMEHHANIVPWQMIAKETGAIIKVIPVTDSGDLDLEAYKKLFPG